MQPSGLLELMTRLGYVDKALQYVKSDDDAGLLTLHTNEVLRGLETGEPENETLFFRLLRQAVSKVEGDPEAHHLLPQLLRGCPALPNPEFTDVLKKIVEVFNNSPTYWATPRALAELARLATRCFGPNAAALFDMGLRAINRFTRSSRTLEIERLFTYWTAYDAQAAAAAFATVPTQSQAGFARLIAMIARALAAGGDASALDAARETIRREWASCTDPFEIAAAMTEIANIDLDRGAKLECEGALHSAIEAIEMIGSKGMDPNADDVARLADAGTSRIRLVPVLSRLGPDRAQDALQAAWSDFCQFGAAEASLRTLVLVQIQLDPTALLLAIEASPKGHQGRLFVDAGLEMVARDRVEARNLMLKTLPLSDMARGP
jgi:hypothetical protein